MNSSTAMGNKMLCGTERTEKTCSIHWNENIDRPVPSGETLLTIACQDGHQMELLQRLLKEGASVNKVNRNGNSPLHVAIRERNEEAVDILLEYEADVNARDTSGLTPLHLACVVQNKTLVLKLLKAGSNPDGILDGKYYVSTPLMTAAENKDLEIATLLLEKGAQVDQRDWWQNTALLKAVQCGSKELVQLLLDNGADPNVCNRFGGSALHYATIADYCEISRLLVDAGCHLLYMPGTDKDSSYRYSPLAAAIHRDCFQCFCYFLAKGAEINGEDLKRKTPLVYALSNRAWDCNNYHYRYVPRCFHGTNPPTIDSTRLRFVQELIQRGANLYTAWDYVIWQIRHSFVMAEDEAAIILCIRAMGFVHNEGFKVETFFRTLCLSCQQQAMWVLYLAGFTPSVEDANIALNRLRQTQDEFLTTEDWDHWNILKDYPHPLKWLPQVANKPRTLRNLAAIKVRESLSLNVISQVGLLQLPKPLESLVTLESYNL